MKLFVSITLGVFLSLVALPGLVFPWCDDCDGSDCCACPGEAQCLNGYSSCEEACGLVSSAPIVYRDYEAEAAVASNAHGLEAMRQGSVTEAIGYYQQALAKKPYDEVIRNNLGTAINEQGNAAWKSNLLSAAIGYYQEAVEYSPNDAVIRDNLNRVTAQLTQEQAKLREQERQRQESIERAKIQTVEIQKVASSFSLSEKLAASVKTEPIEGATVGDAFNTRKAQPALQFGNPSEDLREKARDWFEELGQTLSAASAQSVKRLSQINNDPRMLAMDQELSRLKDVRDQAARESLLLTAQADQALDSAKKIDLTEELDQKKQEGKSTASAVAKKEEAKKNLHRMINTEIEKKE